MPLDDGNRAVTRSATARPRGVRQGGPPASKRSRASRQTRGAQLRARRVVARGEEAQLAAWRVPRAGPRRCFREPRRSSECRCSPRAGAAQLRGASSRAASLPQLGGVSSLAASRGAARGVVARRARSRVVARGQGAQLGGVDTSTNTTPEAWTTSEIHPFSPRFSRDRLPSYGGASSDSQRLEATKITAIASPIGPLRIRL